MNILPNGQINHELTLVDILLGKRINNIPDSNKTRYSKRDTIVISSEARAMSVPKISGGRAYNTRIDSTIDLQSYIDAARKTNRKSLV